MSFDTKLLRYCDHKVVEDDYVVEPDLRTIHLDTTVANTNSMIVKMNGVIYDRNNKSEIIEIEDVTSQITGSNSIFVASLIPIYDGSNKKRLATRSIDVIVPVTVNDEDASAQFTGVDTLLVTQHRPLMSLYNIYANDLSDIDIIVKVNAVQVDIDNIEPVFGKIILKVAPAAGATVTVTYTYKAHVQSIDANSGRITIKEKPAVGQNISLIYYHLVNDGWIVQYDSTGKTSMIIFDQPKQTNQFLIQDELIQGFDVNLNYVTQFSGIKSSFYTANALIIKPRAKLKTQPVETLITQVAVMVNGVRVTPQNMDAEAGFIELGFVPKLKSLTDPSDLGDIVTISYNYRDENAPTDIFSIDYQVTINSCRKCIRTGQVNDYDYDKLGELITVVREQKMLQDLLKLTTAIKGSNTAHPWWGTSLDLYIGTARVPEYYMPKFKGEIIDAGEKIKDLQTQQTQYQQVDDEEFFSFLDNIVVEQSDVDPNFYDITATVISQAATAIELNTSLYFNKPLFSTQSV